jgi:hypothetical protein
MRGDHDSPAPKADAIKKALCPFVTLHPVLDLQHERRRPGGGVQNMEFFLRPREVHVEKPA